MAISTEVAYHGVIPVFLHDLATARRRLQETNMTTTQPQHITNKSTMKSMLYELCYYIVCGGFVWALEFISARDSKYC